MSINNPDLKRMIVNCKKCIALKEETKKKQKQLVCRPMFISLFFDVQYNLKILQYIIQTQCILAQESFIILSYLYVAVVAIDVQAVEGKSVVLPCDIVPPNHDKVYMVFWFQDDAGIPLYRSVIKLFLFFGVLNYG